MTADQRTRPTRQECIDQAAAIYAGILADPVRAAQIRAVRARVAAEQAATQTVAASGGTRRHGTSPTTKPDPEPTLATSRGGSPVTSQQSA